MFAYYSFGQCIYFHYLPCHVVPLYFCLCLLKMIQAFALCPGAGPPLLSEACGVRPPLLPVGEAHSDGLTDVKLASALLIERAHADVGGPPSEC